VSDWRDDEFEDDVPARAGEGVRIVGAGGPADPQYADPQYADPQYADPQYAGAQYAEGDTTGRFPLPGEEESWPAEAGGWDESAPAGSPELQHWTEPATGEVPSVLGGGADDFDSWSALPGPRFRVGESDWADEDFAGGELRKDDSTAVGALADDEYGDHDAYAPPERGRRGRGRGRGRAAPVEEPMDDGGGGLEGSPVYAAAEGHDDHGGARNDLASRVVTAAIVAAVGLAAFAAGRAAATFLVTVIVGVCAFELYEAFRRSGYHTATVIGLLGCVAAVPLAYNQGERGIVMVSVLVVVFTFLWYLFEVVHARPTVNVALTLLVFCWIGFLGAFAGLLLSPDPGGTGLLLGVVACVVGADVVAYFVGRAIGSTPLMPRVSPGKTVEGLIGGAIAAVVLGGVVGAALHPWADKGILAGIGLGIVVAITAPLGDLVESLVKRDLGVKDMGTFLPGHGGFIDRFDAILFTLPAAYYLALQIFS
jgi:phosphatidate cytidylyltransferase